MGVAIGFRALRESTRRPRVTIATVWEAVAESRTAVAPERIWALWEDASRWGEWNQQIAEASLEGRFAEGSTAKIRFKRSPMTMRFSITNVEAGRLFVDETRLPGARMGHEHRVERADNGSLIRHRLYIDGPLERLYVALLGRQMGASVETFGPREAEIAGPAEALGSR
jgi:hypothetical protein